MRGSGTSIQKINSVIFSERCLLPRRNLFLSNLVRMAIQKTRPWVMGWIRCRFPDLLDRSWWKWRCNSSEMGCSVPGLDGLYRSDRILRARSCNLCYPRKPSSNMFDTWTKNIYTCMSDALHTMHWLPVKQRINLKSPYSHLSFCSTTLLPIWQASSSRICALWCNALTRTATLFSATCQN